MINLRIYAQKKIDVSSSHPRTYLAEMKYVCVHDWLTCINDHHLNNIVYHLAFIYEIDHTTGRYTNVSESTILCSLPQSIQLIINFNFKYFLKFNVKLTTH